MMQTKQLLILLLIGFLICSCENSGKNENFSKKIQDTIGPEITQQQENLISPEVRASVWKELIEKIDPIAIPAKIDCGSMNDSVKFELSISQIEALIPKELIKQKDPVISAIHSLKNDTAIIGLFYCIQYPVVFNPLEDITCEIVLILYNSERQYTDYRTLSIDEYGNGYSNIKSVNEILYLYSSEMETIETDIKTFSIKNNTIFEEVNTVHFSSRGSQIEYDRNNSQIEKYMK